MIKLRYFIILLLCYTRYIFFGKAARPVANLKTVLIVQLAQLGDMVCTTPVFRAVKSKFPAGKLIVVGKSSNKALLSGHPFIDEYVSYDGDFFKTLKYLKGKNIDFAAAATPNFISLAFLYLAGIKTITAPIVEGGYSPYETVTYRLLRKFVIAVPHRMGHYAPREYLRLLEPMGIYTDDTKKTLALSDEAVKKINNFFNENNLNRGELIVGIAPGSGNKIKNWRGKNFAEVATYLHEKHKAKIIVIGAPGDREEAEEMLHCLPNDIPVINTQGVLNVEELKALIARFSLIISVDSGPIYIAEAFGIPTIDIVGSLDEREQPPIGQFHKVVMPKRDKPELHIMNARVYDVDEARRQVESITVAEVTGAFEELKELLGKNETK